MEQIENVNALDKFKFKAKRDAIMVTRGAVGFDATAQIRKHYRKWHRRKEKEYYKIASEKMISERRKAYANMNSETDEQKLCREKFVSLRYRMNISINKPPIEEIYWDKTMDKDPK